MKIPVRQYWALLREYLAPQAPRVWLLALLIFAGIGMQLGVPQILRHFIDEAKTDSPLSVLFNAALLYLALSIAQQAAGVTATYVGQKIGWRATNGLRLDVALHCLRLDMGFHNARTPGELIEWIDGDVKNLATFFSDFVIRLLGNLVLLWGVLAILFYEHLWIGAAMTIYAGLALAGLVRFRGIAVPYWKEARQASADLFGYLEERLGGTVDIRSNGGVPYAMRNLYRHTGNRLQTELKASVVTIRLRYLITGVYSGGQILAVILGYNLYREDAITLGTVVLILAYTDTLFRPLTQITRQMEGLQKASASIDRIAELLSTENAIIETATVAIPTGPWPVSFEHINFAYNEGDPVLKDVTFELQAGRVLGLLGRTGSGKTTISRLLLRLYDPDTGIIRVGGCDIRDAGISELRSQVGLVTQSVQLFAGTLRDNLTLFNRNLSDSRILEVIVDLGLDTWFGNLPKGLETPLKSDGSGISSGEAQLLAFARIFLRDPCLVILDEASAHLDPATETRIEHAVDRLLKNRTGIIIAHRLSTVERTDDIIVLEGGRIEEAGERLALAADKTSHFARLLKTGLTEMVK